MQNTNPNIVDYAMEKLTENRIVMIGDHGHASAVPMREVISVLDAWADAMEEGKNPGFGLDYPAAQRLFGSFDQPPDGYIIHGLAASFMHSEKIINRTFSESIVEHILERLRRRNSLDEKEVPYFEQLILREWFFSLWLVGGKDMRNIDVRDPAAVRAATEELSAWKAAASLDVVEDIASLAVYERLVEWFFTSRKQEEISTGIQWYLGYLDHKDLSSVVAKLGSGIPEQLSNMKKYLRENKTEIVARSLIDIMWIGTEKEKTKAAAMLRDLTGMELGSPKEWSEWHRESCE
jgi:hypothetical protein